jgi:hypothetical protein
MPDWEEWPHKAHVHDIEVQPSTWCWDLTFFKKSIPLSRWRLMNLPTVTTAWNNVVTFVFRMWTELHCWVMLWNVTQIRIRGMCNTMMQVRWTFGMRWTLFPHYTHPPPPLYAPISIQIWDQLSLHAPIQLVDYRRFIAGSTHVSRIIN